jgi:hypothetical protein
MIMRAKVTGKGRERFWLTCCHPCLDWDWLRKTTKSQVKTSGFYARTYSVNPRKRVSRDSVVGIVIWTQTGRTGVRILVGARSVSVLQNARAVSGAYPASLQRISGFFIGIKQLGHEVNLSLPSSVEVKHETDYTLTPPICLTKRTQRWVAYS